jgi:Ion channel
MKWHYGRLCVLLSLSITLEMPLREAGYGSLLFGLLIVSVTFAAASAAGDTKLLRRMYLALVAPVKIIDIRIMTMGAGDGLALVGAAFQTTLLSFAAIAILFHVLRIEHVSLDTILGGVCVYLLIGETFAYLCSMMELMRAGSYLEGGHALRIPPNVNHLLGRRPELTYFSFLTLTTVGFGDIVPVAPLARVLAMVEALLGQIFLATFLAFLVGNLLSQKQKDERKATAI